MTPTPGFTVPMRRMWRGANNLAEAAAAE